MRLGATYSIQRANAEEVEVTVDIVLADGTASHGITAFPLDRTPAPASRNSEADLAAARLPAPGVLVVGLSKGGCRVRFEFTRFSPMEITRSKPRFTLERTAHLSRGPITSGA